MVSKERCVDPVNRNCKICHYVGYDYHPDYPHYFGIFCLLGCNTNKQEEDNEYQTENDKSY